MTRTELIRAGPYRIFFPLGLAAGLLGVGHWLFWSVGWLKESNSLYHALMQVQGFLACFVIGFLMTALPRFLGTFTANTAELLIPWCLELAVIVSLLVKEFAAAEICFLLTLGFTVIFLARRFPHRTKNPPASFLLIAFGLLQAFMGPILILASRFGASSATQMEIGRQMLQVGFLLCLVLGIAGYLAPFLMGYASDPSCDPHVSSVRGAGWKALLFHGLGGALIAGSFFGASERAAHAGSIIRAIVALLHLILFAKIARPIRKKQAYVYFFWTACWMVGLGLAVVALWPDWRLAGLHILFIGGFSLMIFSFGLLVVLSHGAQADLLNTRLIPLKMVGISVLAAMGMRVMADFDAWHNRLWLHMASGTWVLAATLWLIYVFPKLYRIPPFIESGPSYRPPA